MGVIEVRLWRRSRPRVEADEAGFKTFQRDTVVSLCYRLTQPELSTEVTESCHIVLPPSEEIHRTVLPPLEDLQPPIRGGPT